MSRRHGAGTPVATINEPGARGPAEPGNSRQGAILFAMSLGFAVVQLDVSVVNVAIKSIGAALGGGVSGLQWVVSSYTVAFGSRR